CRASPACCADHPRQPPRNRRRHRTLRDPMSNYKAPIDDIRFVLSDVFGAPALFARLGLLDASEDVVDAVLEEAARFTGSVLAPLNAVGDRQGCRHDPATGDVSTPEGFKAAYAQF